MLLTSVQPQDSEHPGSQLLFPGMRAQIQGTRQQYMGPKQLLALSEVQSKLWLVYMGPHLQGIMEAEK